MATSDYIWVQGTCKWAKVFKENMDTKFGDKFRIDLYPTEKSKQSLKDVRFRGKEREDEDGKFFRFTRDNAKEFKGKEKYLGPPKITWAETGADYDRDESGLIGNGSNVGVLLEVFDSKYGRGSRMLEVKVIKHIPFNPEAQEKELPFIAE